MTTNTAVDAHITSLAPTAIGSAALAAALTAIGTAGLFEDSDVGPDWSEWVLFNLPLIALATVLVFGLAVRPALRAGTTSRAARTAVVLGALGLLSIIVFWTGLPAVLAGAASLCAAAAKTAQASRTQPIIAVGMATVTVALAVVLAVFG